MIFHSVRLPPLLRCANSEIQEDILKLKQIEMRGRKYLNDYLARLNLPPLFAPFLASSTWQLRKNKKPQNNVED